MTGMFLGCSSLITLPKISKWNISKVISINFLFSFCNSLIYFPSLDDWDTTNCLFMREVFYDCINSINYEEIKKNLYGNKVFYKIEDNSSHLLGDYNNVKYISKITGIIINLNLNEIYHILEDDNYFQNIVLEILNLIKDTI